MPLTQPIYQVDAFANAVFQGNPAAICPLARWLPDRTMQAIAAENNLSETAFVVREEDGYHIRWFTPRHEAPLCGHATLAAAYVLFEEVGVETPQLRFRSRSGPLRVRREEGWLAMDFPAYEMQPVHSPPEFLTAFDIPPVAVYRVAVDPNYYLLYDSEAQIRKLQPDLALLERWPSDGFAVSAPGTSADCISRYFAPGAGIPEDPVTGSIHAALVPYWAAQLGQMELHAVQASARGGELHCTYHPDRQRVTIRGRAVLYLKGTISLPDEEGETV